MELKSAESPVVVKTFNGNPSFATIGKPHLDFFGGASRQSSSEEIDYIVQNCWKEDPRLTIPMLFQKRDCRGGAGERKPFLIGLQVLPQTLRQQLYPIIPNYGYWDDLNALARAIPEDRPFIAEFLADRLIDNMIGFEHGVIHKNLEKWLPTEHQQDDRAWKAVKLITEAFSPEESLSLRQPVTEKVLKLTNAAAQKSFPGIKVEVAGKGFMYSGDTGGTSCEEIWALLHKWDHVMKKATKLPLTVKKLTPSGYRRWCTFMRAYSDVVEHYIQEDLSMIDYNKVPLISFSRNKKHLSEYDAGRFTEFIQKAKIDVSRLMPFQLLAQPSSEVRDEQWKLIVKETREFFETVDPKDPFHPKNSIHVADVSGSMTHFKNGTVPIHVAKSLAILMAEVSGRPIYTFSQIPRKIEPTWETLTVAQVVLEDENVDTDLKPLLNKIHEEEKSAKAIFIYTDGSFDKMCGVDPITAADNIREKFSDWPEPPVVIFWNVAGNLQDTPIAGHFRIIQIAGFNKDLYKIFTRFSSQEDLSVERFFREAILTERYKMVLELYDDWKETKNATRVFRITNREDLAAVIGMFFPKKNDDDSMPDLVD